LEYPYYSSGDLQQKFAGNTFAIPKTMKNWSILSKAVFVSIITSTVSHEDLEGFCSVVLPEYPTNWGVDIISFI